MARASTAAVKPSSNVRLLILPSHVLTGAVTVFTTACLTSTREVVSAKRNLTLLALVATPLRTLTWTSTTLKGCRSRLAIWVNQLTPQLLATTRTEMVQVTAVLTFARSKQVGSATTTTTSCLEERLWLRSLFSGQNAGKQLTKLTMVHSEEDCRRKTSTTEEGI